MKKLTAAGAAIVGASALLALGSAPAHAMSFQQVHSLPAGPGGADRPHSQMMIRIASANGDGMEAMTLSCPQESSEHPNAAAVCDQLERAEGHVDAIEAADGLCTKEYAPVHVVVAGHWHGMPRFFMGTYGNRCEAVVQTGGALLDL